MWEPLKTLAAISEASYIQAIPVVCRRDAFSKPELQHLFVGSQIVFKTQFNEGTGVVLDIDHGAEYPLKVEYLDKGDKRIVRFKPDEFINLSIKERT